MKKMDLLQAGVEIIVSVGIGAIVGNAVKVTTPSTTKGIEKLAVALGTVVLIGITTGVAAKYTENKIKETAESIKLLFEEEPEEIVVEN